MCTYIYKCGGISIAKLDKQMDGMLSLEVVLRLCCGLAGFC